MDRLIYMIRDIKEKSSRLLIYNQGQFGEFLSKVNT